MGSSEMVARNLELLALQYSAQHEWARQAVENAHAGIAHFSKLADSYRRDCSESFEARASAQTYERAAMIFTEVLDACEWFTAACDRELEDERALNQR